MSADRYTVISADCHAGANHKTYREYLDPAYHADFDAWRGEYKNPWKDLRDTDLRVRNWDDDRRDADLLADGVVAEVVFPNTVPPFYPGFVLFAGPPKPDDYTHRRAGLHAHNRWLVDFCERKPGQRAGVGQIFLNDIDDAIEDSTWIKEHGLLGGVLLPNVAPDVSWVRPLYDPEYDRLWAHLQDLDIPVTLHGGTGSPNYGKYPATPTVMIAEVPFYSVRPFVHMLLSGVFERFPRLKFVLTENAAGNMPPLIADLDRVVKAIQGGSMGELKYREEDKLPRLASEYFAQNCYIGASMPGPTDMKIGDLLPPERMMWGNDYPHDEGSAPFSRESLRLALAGMDEPRRRAVLAENAAALYGFDLDMLAGLAAQHGPTVAELAEPLTELPPEPNSALLNGARQAGLPVPA
ncbi:MAG: amidohydrolase [Acidimicrobiales bacterium]|nr:amidohydrolase [Acidimicrobiales bacterium]